MNVVVAYERTHEYINFLSISSFSSCRMLKEKVYKKYLALGLGYRPSLGWSNSKTHPFSHIL